MPDRNQSFDALFLRAKDSPAGDRIVSMLTAEEGVLDAFVFGGARSSLRSSASPFVFAKVLIYADPVKHYRKLSDMTIIESFSRLRESYSKLWSASVISELIVKTSGCGGEYGEVLDLSLQAFRVLDGGAEEVVDMTLLSYLWKTLGIMGLQPNLDHCSLCGTILTPSDEDGAARSGMQYSATQEGFVCDACGEDGIAIGREELRCLRRFSREGIAESAALRSGDAAISSLKGIIYYLSQKAAERVTSHPHDIIGQFSLGDFIWSLFLKYSNCSGALIFMHGDARQYPLPRS